VSLGIFVEGESDRQTIPILIKKLGYSSAIKSRVVTQGTMLDASKMLRHVEPLLAGQSRISRIIVFRDSEGVDPKATLRRTKPVSKALSAACSVPVSYVVVDHSLEGWLACDIDALKAVLGGDAKLRIEGNPEDNLTPAKLMARIFKKNGQTYKKTVHAAKIAEAVTPRNISEKSPTFRRLMSVLSRGNA